jgi:hypothetical protein
VRSQEKNNHKNYVAIVAAAAAAIGLAGVLVGVLQAAPSFLHIRQNLSNTDYTSAYPDLAVSSDHNYVAVVWVDGYSGISGSRGHVYLRVASESGIIGNPIKVYNGDADACAYDRAAVAIKGTTAHIAYVVWADCISKQDTRLYYTTCSLTNGTCSLNQFVLSSQTDKISWVDIAVDDSGNPHLVFAKYQEIAGLLYGKVIYKRHTGSGWAGEETVHAGTTVNNHTPTIAWGDGCVHIAWEEEKGGDIRYRRRCAGEWDPGLASEPEWISRSSPDYPPHRPHIAAAPGGKVFIVWDRLAQPETAYNPATYYLLYKRSNDGGATFPSDSREVGTDNIGTVFEPYTEEHVAGEAGDVAYLKYLRPSVAVNEDGWPAVVWHTGDVTGTYYTYAISGTDTSVDWVTTKMLLFAGEAGAPVVGFGDFITGTIPLLHVAYMDATGSSWEVYYDSNEADVIDIPTVYLPLVMRGY